MFSKYRAAIYHTALSSNIKRLFHNIAVWECHYIKLGRSSPINIPNHLPSSTLIISSTLISILDLNLVISMGMWIVDETKLQRILP